VNITFRPTSAAQTFSADGSADRALDSLLLRFRKEQAVEQFLVARRVDLGVREEVGHVPVGVHVRGWLLGRPLAHGPIPHAGHLPATEQVQHVRVHTAERPHRGELVVQPRLYLGETQAVFGQRVDLLVDLLVALGRDVPFRDAVEVPTPRRLGEVEYVRVLVRFGLLLGPPQRVLLALLRGDDAVADDSGGPRSPFGVLSGGVKQDHVAGIEVVPLPLVFRFHTPDTGVDGREPVVRRSRRLQYAPPVVEVPRRGVTHRPLRRPSLT
jgi:hypothetical protein